MGHNAQKKRQNIHAVGATGELAASGFWRRRALGAVPRRAFAQELVARGSSLALRAGMERAPPLSVAAGLRRRRRDFLPFSPRPSRSCSGCRPRSPSSWRRGSRCCASSRALMLPCSSALAAFFAGELLAARRAARIDAPVLERMFVGELAGFVEEVDPRAQVGRTTRVSCCASTEMEKTRSPAATPLSGAADHAQRAGTSPPAISSPPRRGCCRPPHAALPGGYDFARDA